MLRDANKILDCTCIIAFVPQAFRSISFTHGVTRAAFISMRCFARALFFMFT